MRGPDVHAKRRVARSRRRAEARGLVRVEVVIPKSRAQELRRLAASFRFEAIANKTVFRDRHERRDYLAATEVGRMLLNEPDLVRKGVEFIERHYRPDPRQMAACHLAAGDTPGLPSARSRDAATPYGPRAVIKRRNVDHVLRAAGAILDCRKFVVVGTGAVVATTKRLPAGMMMTSEVDLYADDGRDPDPAADLIDGTIGRDSPFHQAFGYYGDGVSPNTALLPRDWRDRATTYRGAEAGEIVALCPDANDIAFAKLCAFRDKDRDWLVEGIQTGIVDLKAVEPLIAKRPAKAPTRDMLRERLAVIASRARLGRRSRP
ncbi:MAG: hypothetical protein FJX47_08605 [Alphaproteobacteria bacterium]|nr:hypothetical protein [Alphaproteobacteria bacterium]